MSRRLVLDVLWALGRDPNRWATVLTVHRTAGRFFRFQTRRALRHLVSTGTAEEMWDPYLVEHVYRLSNDVRDTIRYR